MKKQFITAEQLQQDCWQFASHLGPKGPFDAILGITRGGAQIAIYIQEVLNLYEQKTIPFAMIHARSYVEPGKAGDVWVDLPRFLMEKIKQTQSVLIVDDIFDRGKTLEAVLKQIRHTYPGLEKHCKVAALYYKPENRQVTIKPDYYFQKFNTKNWLVLPHELSHLNKDELKEKGFNETI